LGWALVKRTARKRKTRKAKAGKGFRVEEGTLALGTSMRGTVGTRGASTGASGADGTIAMLDGGGESRRCQGKCALSGKRRASILW